MSHPRLILCAFAAVLAAPLATSPAHAADLDGSYGPPPPGRFAPPPPDWAPPPPRPLVRGPDGPCRVFLKRRPGPFGEDEVRRVRVCDEGPAVGHGGPRWSHEGPPPFRHHERPPLVPDDAPGDLPED